MKNILNIIEIVVAIFMIILILLQNKGVGLSATFGGEGSIYHSKHGVEKGIFVLTIISAFIFVTIGILQLIIK